MRDDPTRNGWRRPPGGRALALVAVLLVGSCTGEPEPWIDEREPCADRNELRNLYWGDLHVHTAYSFDAWMNDVRLEPEDAYRFARGEPVDLPPLDAMGRGTQTVRLDRPLDFAAVTDHAEFLAEVEACKTPGSSAYDSDTCQAFRVGDDDALAAWGLRLNPEQPRRFTDICGEDGSGCAQGASSVWLRLREAAESAYDRSEACEFTSLVAYEYSGISGLSNLHRNVIFRSSQVPAVPVSHFDEPDPAGLWRALERDCIDRINGCDVLAIPHNSNWSNGRLFVPEYPSQAADAPAGVGEAEDLDYARRRARLEPLMEIYQHKGDSECRDGLGVLGAPDELCGFEKLRGEEVTDCGDGTGTSGIVAGGCVSRADFLRGALLLGLEEELRLGVNPLELGVIASTDTHNATPGLVDERAYPGHFGIREADLAGRLDSPVPGGRQNSPGGLAAVWAEENTREAIFDALRRRETYGTSGPRIAVRFFGGNELPGNLCERGDLVEVGYESGVPMGGSFSAGEAPPTFVALALADPGTEDAPGLPLQRLQIIKGWIDAEGGRHVEVFDVAGGDDGASVDEGTCEPVTGSGSTSLCATWTDPDHDPSRPAWYYVRAVEDPSCRWSWRQCLEAPADERPDTCDDPELARIIQERAWTSPIWVRPAN